MDEETLYHLYIEKNMTLTQIGEMFNCDRNNVRYYLKKYGIKLKTRKESQAHRVIDNLTIDSIMFLVECKGLLVNDIAEYYGVSRSTIRQRLSDNNISLRNHVGQCKKQSTFMSENNPVPKGTKRDKASIEALKEGKRLSLIDKINNFLPSSFYEYAKFARYLSYKNYGLSVPNGYHIDHIYSVSEGYKNNVPVEIISNPKNLRLITAHENIAKNNKCDITIDELYLMVGVQRLSCEGVEGSPSKSEIA